MYETPSYRHADEPVRLLLWEIEDWVACVVVFVGGLFLLPFFFGMLAGRLTAVVLSILVLIVTRRIKRGKPRGYLTYLLHRSGLTRWLPSRLRPKGTLPAPSPIGGPLTLLRPWLSTKPHCATLRGLREEA